MLHRSSSQKSPAPPICDPAWWKTIPFPGLTGAIEDIQSLFEELPKRCAVQRHKRQQEYLWVVFLGGTGTGKSTLFNALCGLELSQASLERPKTGGPVAFVHQKTRLEKDLPFFTGNPERVQVKKCSHAQSGTPGQLLLIEHTFEAYEHLIIVDTPDVDSLHIQNRKMTETLYLLADVVLFVTSQEKYADQVPFEFLRRTYQDSKDCFFLFNKAETSPYRVNQDPNLQEVMTTLNTHGIKFPDSHYLIMPSVKDRPFEYISGHPLFLHFRQTFLNEFSKKNTSKVLKQELQRAKAFMQQQAATLSRILSEEETSAQQWIQDLDKILEGTWNRLLSKQEETFSSTSRKYIQSEIKNLFSRYDLLGKPRRFIGTCLTFPLRAIKGKIGSPKIPGPFDWRTDETMHLNPILEAVDEFNRHVLEHLMPFHEASPLGKQLRDHSFALSHEAVQEQARKVQKELNLWLKGRFKKLSRELPQGKKWGIYSTSLMWGFMLLSLEIVIGGGITMVEAVLDSAIAPFMTKGAVDLFAYREIQKVAKEMAQHYQKGLYSILQGQRDRYLDLLNGLRTPETTFSFLHAFQQEPDLSHFLEPHHKESPYGHKAKEKHSE